MPTIERDGATLSFEERGEGPAVILQHALSADARSWAVIGVVESLVANGFRVILPDALGHGRSAPAQGDRVGLVNRVSDLLAVTDALDVDEFHFAGYSMGGWLGVGLLRDAPQRLLSLAIAGWDPIDGARRFTQLSDTSERRCEFLEKIAALIERAPGSSQPDTTRMEGYADTYERLFRELPSALTLIDHDVPIMLSVGRDDPYREAVAAAADGLGIEPVELAGDHITAFLDPAFGKALADWLEEQRCPENKRALA